MRPDRIQAQLVHKQEKEVGRQAPRQGWCARQDRRRGPQQLSAAEPGNRLWTCVHRHVLFPPPPDVAVNPERAHHKAARLVGPVQRRDEALAQLLETVQPQRRPA